VEVEANELVYELKHHKSSRSTTTRGDGWQEGWDDTFGDVQRYLYDSYVCRVYATKLAGKKITVSVSLLHLQEGICMWQDFWRFEPTEASAARAVYSEVKKAMADVFEHFKTNAIPNNLLFPHMREACREIAPDKKPSCRIPMVDAARKIQNTTDWRESIYGTRYPESDGF
jgi:hypothetical protein